MGAETEQEQEQERQRGQQENGQPPPAIPNPITEAQFLSWKRRKDANASAAKTEAARKREEDIAAGTVQMNGRELFLREPWVFDNSLY